MLKKTKLAHYEERVWRCCFPKCNEKFTTTHNNNDQFFCKEHLREKHKIDTHIKYVLKKTESSYYRKKRVQSLRKQIAQHEKNQERIYTLLQINRSKMQIMTDELEWLEKRGGRV